MNILITRNDPESYRHYRRLLWKLAAQSVYRYTFLMLIGGIISFLLGAFAPYTSSSTFSANTETRTYNYNYHVSIGIGLGLVLIGLYHLLQLQRSKSRFLAAGESFLFRARQSKHLERSLLLTDDWIEYSTFEGVYRTKWSAFSSFRVRKDFVIFYEYDRRLSPYVVELSRLNAEEQQMFLTFLSTSVMKPLGGRGDNTVKKK